MSKHRTNKHNIRLFVTNANTNARIFVVVFAQIIIDNNKNNTRNWYNRTVDFLARNKAINNVASSMLLIYCAIFFLQCKIDVGVFFCICARNFLFLVGQKLKLKQCDEICKFAFDKKNAVYFVDDVKMYMYIHIESGAHSFQMVL